MNTHYVVHALSFSETPFNLTGFVQATDIYVFLKPQKQQVVTKCVLAQCTMIIPWYNLPW